MNQLILIILDGWGWSKTTVGNAILNAKTPFLDTVKKQYPFFLLQASGQAVGLPPLQEGNSEVGHLTIGAGRIIPQHLTRINQALKDGSFFKNKTFLSLLDHIKQNSSNLHLMGLLTSGTVHASIHHLLEIIKFLKRKNLPNNIIIHLFTDGKDSGKKESLSLINLVKKEIQGKANFKIGSIVGRNFAMDRENNWNLTKQAYDLLVNGIGNKTDNLENALAEYHSKGITDESIPPTILNDNSVLIKNGDGILFFNFREDNARQLTRMFTDKQSEIFEVSKLKNIFFATMTDYGKNINANPIFIREEIKNTLSEVLQNNNKNQLKIAETVKYAHLTYFFNGLRSKPFKNEADIIIPSLKNPENNPEMKSAEIAEKITKEIERKFYEFIAVNFANADILSHTGNFQATIKGVESIDRALEKIYKQAQKSGTKIIITADHGNAEALTYIGTGEIETKHNQNPVPFYLVIPEFKKQKTDKELLSEEEKINGMLIDVAPTILEIMKIKKPKEMTGINLLGYLDSTYAF